MSPDGKFLTPPGPEQPFVATAAGTPRRTAVILRANEPAAHDGLPSVAMIGQDRTRPPPASLYVLDRGGAGGRGSIEHAARLLRGQIDPAPLAAPGPVADVMVEPLPGDSAGVARAVLAAGVRAGGRPLLVEAGAPATADDLLCALDLGAAGALVRTGDEARDAELVEELSRLESERLSGAPAITVVVCNRDGAGYLERCLASLSDLRYPAYEVLVVDDGSSDDSAAIARGRGARVLELGKPSGLAAARNAGIEAARGEIVAFVDVDAAADRHLLERVWRLLDRLGADGTGGPNLPFPDAGWRERAVSGAPGAPIPVVARDGSALHLPGCNMAFRRDALLRVGGLDARFPGAADDVDLCKRLIDSGSRLVFHPTAAVYHHRRSTLTGFLRQQRSYGGGVPSYEAVHGEPGAIPRPPRSLARRLDPRRPRPVFSGPQARQLYTVADEPLHVDLPLKGAVALTALWLAGAAPAAAAGRWRAWAALGAAAGGGLLAFVAARVPAVGAAPSPRGAPQRLATAALWLAQPVAWRLGERSARRGEGTP